MPGPDHTTRGGVVSRLLERIEADEERIWHQTTVLRQPSSTSGVPVDVWADWLRKMYGAKE